MAASTATVKIKHTIVLSEELSDRYSERAAKLGITPESEMSARLRKCVEHTAQQGVYLDDSARQRLSQLTGKLMATPQDVLAHVEYTAQIRVGDVDIPLDGQLLIRLETRRFGKTFDQMLRDEVIKALETFVGLR